MRYSSKLSALMMFGILIGANGCDGVPTADSPGETGLPAPSSTPYVPPRARMVVMDECGDELPEPSIRMVAAKTNPYMSYTNCFGQEVAGYVYKMEATSGAVCYPDISGYAAASENGYAECRWRGGGGASVPSYVPGVWVFVSLNGDTLPAPTPFVRPPGVTVDAGSLTLDTNNLTSTSDLRVCESNSNTNADTTVAYSADENNNISLSFAGGTAYFETVSFDTDSTGTYFRPHGTGGNVSVFRIRKKRGTETPACVA